MSYEVQPIGFVKTPRQPARRVFKRGTAVVGRRFKSERGRLARRFSLTTTRSNRRWPPPGWGDTFPSQVTRAIDGVPMEFSLRPPKWLRKGIKKVAKGVFKVAKIAVPVAAAVVLAPAAAGLLVRGGVGAFKVAKIGARLGGRIFRKTSGLGSGAVPSIDPNTGAASGSYDVPGAPGPSLLDRLSASIPESMASGQPQPASNVAMTASGPAIPYGDGGGAGEAEATEAVAESKPMQAGGPALAIGAVVVGALLLSQRKRR